MGIENIIKGSQEETPSSDSLPQDGLFFEETEAPLVIDVYSDTSDTESFSELQDAEELLNIISFSTSDVSDDESPSSPPVSSPVFPLQVESQETQASCNDTPTTTSLCRQEKPMVSENKRVRKATKSRRSNMGKKKARRFENARELALLISEEEQDMYDCNDFMPFDCSFRFSRILEDAELSNKILNPTLDVVEELSKMDLAERSRKKKNEVAKSKTPSPAEAFNNLDSSQKSFFKRRNLPMGMVQYLDTCVFSFFENNPTGTYISEPLTSFERMMLHSIAHYYELNSYSFEAEDHLERLTKVTNNTNYFKPPCLCLSRYLEEHLWKNLNSSPASKRRRCRRS